ncbi:cytochrome P450 [Boletus edulis BED1]|uniref:Cytochrome P450 n=1 Tax=Boletus edulis BED1 TaxID=1328754 RepID=A0AAD4C1S5_BOLED|nr:cytochrome P450 [Boletus edulis BED1]
MDSAHLLLYGLTLALVIVILIDRPLLSYYGAAKFILHARSMVQQGYDLYKDNFFRVPMMDRWLVVLTGPKLVEELRKIPDDKLSFDHAMRDILQVKYTFGLETQTHPYHVTVVHGQLKRKLGDLFPDIHHEICQTFEEILPTSNLGWVSVPAYSAVMKATCRTSNRVFVGLPICQSPEFADVLSNFALQIIFRASLVNFFPKLMHPIIGRVLTNTPSSLKRCMALVQPIVEERLKRYNSNPGDELHCPPDDMITWLIQVSKPEDRNLRSICLRILVLNFASLHTTAQTLAHALLNLTSHPQYLEPLREEVREVTEQYGWSKYSMGMLVKMESFLRESQRVSGTSLFPIVRKAMEDITFSDGTTIPAGTHLVVASVPMHLDDRYYENASEFDAFRFLTVLGAGEGSLQTFRLSSTNRLYLVFGHGNRACPGRFFVSTTMTAMMAHLVLNYDMKLKDGVRPPDQWFQMNCSPNRAAEIMFRRRSS